MVMDPSMSTCCALRPRLGLWSRRPRRACRWAVEKNAGASAGGYEGYISLELDRRSAGLGNAHAAAVETCSPRYQGQPVSLRAKTQ